MQNVYSPQFDSFNMRSQSPQRSEPIDFNRGQNPLYMSPSGPRDLQSEGDFRMSKFSY